MPNESGGGKSRSKSAPPRGRYYPVNGRRLALHRSGSGSPAVVLLPGGGAVGLDYLNVQERAARLTTSVLYDRGGTGWSDRVRQPRTAAHVTDELRGLLQSAGVPVPFVLVGHSLGGLFARHYAQRFPHEVAGLVLLDPAHEDYDSYMPQELNKLRGVTTVSGEAIAASDTPTTKRRERILTLFGAGLVRFAITRGLLEQLPQIRRYRVLYRDLFAQEMTDWPADVRAVLIERHVGLEWLWAGLQESNSLYALYDEVRRAGPMPDVPLIILCSTGTDAFKAAVSVGESEELLRAEVEGKTMLYEAVAASVTRGDVRLVETGHFTMHFRHPDAVLRAIRDVIAQAAT